MALSEQQQMIRHIKRWKNLPTMFVMDVLKATPDPWQAQALIHLAPRPPGPDKLREIFLSVRTAYGVKEAQIRDSLLQEDNADMRKALRIVIANLERSKHWTDDSWIAQDYQRPFRRVVVASGHGVGKSCLMAWMILWMLVTCLPLKFGVTAPTAHQLENIIWPEVRMWHKRMSKWLQDQIVISNLRIEIKDEGESAFVTGRTARREQPEALQGLHALHTGIAIDEASGVHDEVFVSSEGIMTADHTCALMAGNPTRTDGFFHMTHAEMTDYWYAMTVSSEDNPRVAKDFVESIARRYGKESNTYRVRVLGLFPRGDDDAAIPRYMVEDALARDIQPYVNSSVVWGVDPATTGGDRTALSIRRGNVKIGRTQWWERQDTTVTANRIITQAKAAPEHLYPVDVVVDVNGVGAGVADQLRAAGLPVTGVYCHQSAMEPERFHRLYDELWFKAREWFESPESCLEDDEPDLFRELTQVRIMQRGGQGRYMVETTNEVKRRVHTKQSPDLAMSWILTFASARGSLTTIPEDFEYENLNSLAVEYG